MKQYLIAGTLCFAFWTIADGVDINGKVRSGVEKYATVTSDSDLLPKPGDKANIFFTLPGSSAEISVAVGHVYEITGEDIMVEIDNATGTVGKDQLVRITSPSPRKRSMTEDSPAKNATSNQSLPATIDFDNLAPGLISEEAFLDRGIRLRMGKGKPGIYQAEPNMVMPSAHRNVLLLADERVTSLTFVFDNPIKRFTLLRIGAAGGASLPTWTMTAYDGNGKTIGSAGETHAVRPEAQLFAIEGNGITQVEISTDNRYGTGTWATWNSLPIAALGFDR